jgi:hypothetical protein
MIADDLACLSETPLNSHSQSQSETRSRSLRPTLISTPAAVQNCDCHLTAIERSRENTMSYDGTLFAPPIFFSHTPRR